VLLAIGVVVTQYNRYEFCVHLANKLYIFDSHDENQKDKPASNTLTYQKLT
jgi:hypothetical protein